MQADVDLKGRRAELLQSEDRLKKVSLLNQRPGPVKGANRYIQTHNHKIT